MVPYPTPAPTGVKFSTDGRLLRTKFHSINAVCNPYGAEKPQNWPLSIVNTDCLPGEQ